MDELAKRIRSRREKLGLKQNDVASALQVSPQAVSKWERGENAPDIAQLVPLARLLGVTVEWILDAYAEQRDVFEAAVLAAGAENARGMSEKLTPRDFAEWANGCCAQLTEAVLRHDGVPVKYMGPGILAFFSGGEHTRRALAAAVAGRRVSAAPIKAGIGEGPIYFGPIGHPDYAQPDVMGEPVSIALLVMDWAAANTRSGIAACVAAADCCGEGLRLGRARRVRFEHITHQVSLRTVGC